MALEPLADRLAGLLLERSVPHADETPVAQLDPGRGKTKRAYLWAYRSNVLETGPPILLFDYQTSRAGRHAQEFLSGWQGSLTVDDFGGYKELFTHGVTELCCLAHARRKYFDLNEAQANPIAQEALRRIARLYAIEVLGRDMTVEARTALRQEHAQAQLQAMHEWLLKTRHGRQCRRDGEGHRLQPETPGGLESLCHRRELADRQQSGGEHLPADRTGKEELALRRVRARRQTRGGDSDFAGHGKTQWA